MFPFLLRQSALFRGGVFAARYLNNAMWKLKPRITDKHSDNWTASFIGAGALTTSMFWNVSTVCCDQYMEVSSNDNNSTDVYGMLESTAQVLFQPFDLLFSRGTKVSEELNNRTCIELDVQGYGTTKLEFSDLQLFEKNQLNCAESIWKDIIGKTYDKINIMDQNVNFDTSFPMLVWELPVIDANGKDDIIKGVINSADSMQFLLKTLRSLIGDESVIQYFPHLKVEILPINHPKGEKFPFKDDRELVQSNFGWNGTTICMLGSTGCGKSTLCNIALGFDFKNGPFDVGNSSKSETKKATAFGGLCSIVDENYQRIQPDVEITDHSAEAEEILQSHLSLDLLKMIDTPGFFDTELSNEELVDKIVGFIQGTQKGPNLLVMCVDMGNPRFTEQEVQTLKWMHQIFGDDMINHLAIVFTKCDTVMAEDVLSRIAGLQIEYAEKIKVILDTEQSPKFFKTTARRRDSMSDVIAYAKGRPAFDSSECRRLSDMKLIELQGEIRAKLKDLAVEVEDLKKQLAEKDKEIDELKKRLVEKDQQLRSAFRSRIRR